MSPAAPAPITITSKSADVIRGPHKNRRTSTAYNLPDHPTLDDSRWVPVTGSKSTMTMTTDHDTAGTMMTMTTRDVGAGTTTKIGRAGSDECVATKRN